MEAIYQQLKNAMLSDGVVRELVLLRTLNSVFEQYSTDENDWQHSSPTEYAKWHEEIKQLLESLEFIIESADSYAPEPTQLSASCQQLQSQQQQAEQRLQNLKQQKSKLEPLLTQTQLTEQQIQQEVILLQTFSELLPLREQLVTEIGETKLRSLSNDRLITQATEKKQGLEQLSLEIQQKLKEQESLLSEDLILQEAEWESLGRRVTQSNK